MSAGTVHALPEPNLAGSTPAPAPDPAVVTLKLPANGSGAVSEAYEATDGEALFSRQQDAEGNVSVPGDDLASIYDRFYALRVLTRLMFRQEQSEIHDLPLLFNADDAGGIAAAMLVIAGDGNRLMDRLSMRGARHG